MSLSLLEVDDIVNSTIDHYPRKKYTELAQQYQSYISARLWKKFTVNYPGGKQITFDINTAWQGNARSSGLFDVIEPKRKQTLIQGSIPWRKQICHCFFDIDEDTFQSDQETIVYLAVQRIEAMKKEMVELIEVQTWSEPATSNDMMGIPFWVQTNVTTPAGAFTGGNPASGNAAGVDSTVYTAWRNWAGQYTDVTSEDLINTIKSAIRDTMFHSEIDFSELKYGENQKQLFMTKDTIGKCERLAETRNENHGPDVIRYMNMTLVAGIPTVYVPYLEQTTSNDPVYGINFGTMRPFSKRGQAMQVDKPVKPYNMPSTRIVYMHNWGNWGCYNRREQFVITTS